MVETARCKMKYKEVGRGVANAKKYDESSCFDGF